jgi:transcriptional regulator with XRE-family HTH domain
MRNVRKLTDFGVIVKKRLIELDMTQSELASRVGTSCKYVNNILYGFRSGEKYLQAIIQELGIDSNSLQKGD